MASILLRAIVDCCKKPQLCHNMKQSLMQATISRMSSSITMNTSEFNCKEAPEITMKKNLFSLRKFAVNRKWLASQHIHGLICGFRNFGPLSESHALFMLEACGKLDIFDDLKTRQEMVANVWSLMAKWGIKLDEEHFSCLLQTHIDNEANIDVEEFLQEMAAANLKPDNRLRWKLFTYHCLKGSIEKAEEMHGILKTNGVWFGENLFTLIMIAHARAKDLDGVLKTVTQMQEKSIKPTERTYETLLQVYAELDKFNEVGMILENISGFCISSSSLLEAYYQFVKHKNKYAADMVYSHIPIALPTEIVVPQVIKFLELTEYEVAYNICLLGMNKATEYKHRYFPYLLSRFTPFHITMSYCERMLTSGINIVGYQTVLLHYCKTGQFDKSLMVLKAMKASKVRINEHYLYPLICHIRQQQKPPDMAELAKVLYFDSSDGYYIYREYVFPSFAPSTEIAAFDTLKQMVGKRSNMSVGLFLYLIMQDRVQEAANFLFDYKFTIPPISDCQYVLCCSYMRNTTLAPLFAKIIREGFCNTTHNTAIVNSTSLRYFLLKLSHLREDLYNGRKNEATLELLQNLIKCEVRLSPSDAMAVKVFYNQFSSAVRECIDGLINIALETKTSNEPTPKFQDLSSRLRSLDSNETTTGLTDMKMPPKVEPLAYLIDAYKITTEK